MTIRLQIDSLEWDEWNLEHIKKHGVTREEIESAVRTVLMIKQSYKDRLVLFCASPTGRTIAVVVGESPTRPNVYYVFSARPAKRQERRTLQQRGES